MFNKPSDYLTPFSSYVDIERSSFKSTGLSTKESKSKQRIVTKELNDKLLNLATTEDKIEKNYSINEQQVTEIDELYDEIWKFDEPIKNLEISLAKNNLVEEIQLIKSRKKKLNEFKAELECKQDLFMQEESETFENFQTCIVREE